MAHARRCDAVRTDGHADSIFTVAVAIDYFAVSGAGSAIHGEHHAIYRYVGAFVVDGAAHLETGDVGKVVTVEGHRTGTDEAHAVFRREFVCAQFGADGVARATARERDATDGIFAALIGDTVETQLCGVGGDIGGCSGPHGGMVAVGDATGARDVVTVLIKSLVERPIHFQVVFTTAEHAVVSVGDVFLCKGLAPNTHLIDVAGETLIRLIRAASEVNRFPMIRVFDGV